MKKYLILSFVFLLISFPVVAKNAVNSPVQSQERVQTRNPSVSPTGQQVQNRNEVQTQNQGEESQLQVKTKESEQLNQEVEESVEKVSDYVHQLIEDRKTTGIKGGIGEKVSEFAQNQQQVQEKIKNSYEQLKNRGQLIRLFVGSDKKMTAALDQLVGENKLRIEELEALKNQTTNLADQTQLQETIDLMLSQNTSLQEKIAKEKQVNGLFGWFLKLFNR
ncbi:MAG: hypothetical protein PHR98_04030 [Candidatus Shapirobacteria bacterium]|nr:hypothetical protein [Candidatus Shapirobacteria bacterium]